MASFARWVRGETIQVVWRRRFGGCPVDVLAPDRGRGALGTAGKMPALLLSRDVLRELSSGRGSCLHFC